MDRLEAKIKKLLLKWGVKEDEADSFLSELKETKDEEEDVKVEEESKVEEQEVETDKPEETPSKEVADEEHEESGVAEDGEEVVEECKSVEEEVKGDESVETEEKVESEEVSDELPPESEEKVETEVEQPVEEGVEEKHEEELVEEKGQDLTFDELKAKNEELEKTLEGLGSRLSSLEELVSALGHDVPNGADNESGLEINPHSDKPEESPYEKQRRRAMGYYE